jgi:hypothetical protein
LIFRDTELSAHTTNPDHFALFSVAFDSDASSVFQDNGVIRKQDSCPAEYEGKAERKCSFDANHNDILPRIFSPRQIAIFGQEA